MARARSKPNEHDADRLAFTLFSSRVFAYQELFSFWSLCLRVWSSWALRPSAVRGTPSTAMRRAPRISESRAVATGRSYSPDSCQPVVCLRFSGAKYTFSQRDTSITLDHMKKLKNNAFHGYTARFAFHGSGDHVFITECEPFVVSWNCRVRVSDGPPDHRSCINNATFRSACKATGISASTSFGRPVPCGV